MKYTILIALLLTTTVSFSKTAKKEATPTFTAKQFDKQIAKIGDKQYAGIAEVSNQEYLLFLAALKQKNEAVYQQALPDTQAWNREGSSNAAYIQYYLRHPAYANYPVVNVTKQQAESYCAWLTEQYNGATKKDFKKIIVRLPNEAEWETAAAGGRKSCDYPWGGPYIRNANGFVLCNFKRIGDECISKNPATGAFELDKEALKNRSARKAGKINVDVVTPVKSYLPNDYGLYNASGNVAELVSDKSVAKGGSWNSAGYDVRIKSAMPAVAPSPEIGFRYIVEVIEE